MRRMSNAVMRRWRFCQTGGECCHTTGGRRTTYLQHLHDADVGQLLSYNSVVEVLSALYVVSKSRTNYNEPPRE